MQRPIIGITANSAWVNASNVLASRYVTMMTNANIKAITDAGGIPILLTDQMSYEDISEIVSAVDGLLIPGGQDIHPQYYGQDLKVTYCHDVKSTGIPYKRPQFISPNLKKDEFELALYRESIKQSKPIFGICRGMQLINVAEGGTLHQEIADVSSLIHEIDHSGYSHHHEIMIKPNSLFFEIFETECYFGPSTHHQAIDNVGANLIASGHAPDGVVEFIEHGNEDLFVVGTQGDVERACANLPGFAKLYERFIDESKFRSHR